MKYLLLVGLLAACDEAQNKPMTLIAGEAKLAVQFPGLAKEVKVETGQAWRFHDRDFELVVSVQKPATVDVIATSRHQVAALETAYPKSVGTTQTSEFELAPASGLRGRAELGKEGRVAEWIVLARGQEQYTVSVIYASKDRDAAARAKSALSIAWAPS